MRSPAQIRATLAAYTKLTGGQDICVKLKRNLNSKLAAGRLLSSRGKQSPRSRGCPGYIAIVGCARNPARYYAEQIHKAFAGIGMDDNKIIRIFVTRSEVRVWIGHLLACIDSLV